MKKLKSVIIGMTMVCFTLPSVAKVTLDDVYKADAQDRADDLARNADYIARHSSPLKPYIGDSTSGQVVEYSTGGETTTVITKTLKSTNGWACALSKVSGYYGRGLKGTDAHVYQSGGYWRLKSGRASCGGCAVSAKAICWETK
ncbi:hypothetical protein FCV53_18520 [Vibrio sp. F12]|uniref:hypothetical protein n=1 Tax=Vibrio sp. F12 TaxID=2070776 RepID=UPI0010BD7E51|nr:hypothetical protein [Vibrio sp. F12]TKE89601.1 hypothetical protein FCV53_18520 [Vibrio sp. F12]